MIGVGILYLIYTQVYRNSLFQDWVAGDERYLTISYDNKQYTYQENFINILCLGIDKEEAMDIRNDEDNSVGQADAIFLVTLDTKKNAIHMISIPRDTMVELQMYDGNGLYAGSRKGQITLQYAYGDGMKKSADLTAKRVTELLNYIPIHGYVAINLESLLRINDLVDGVDITMDEDYTLLDPSFEKGTTIHLEGKKLYQYIHGRDITVRGSSYTRIHRLKQYMMAFFDKAKIILREDISVVKPLLEELEKDMIISFSDDEIMYLITEVLSSDFFEEKIYTLPGEPVRGEIYEEYYPNVLEITELVLELYYKGI